MAASATSAGSRRSTWRRSSASRASCGRSAAGSSSATSRVGWATSSSTASSRARPSSATSPAPPASASGASSSRSATCSAPSASTGRWTFAWRRLALLDLPHQPLDPVVAPEALALVDEEGKAEDPVRPGILVAPLERRLVAGLPQGGEELGAGEPGALGDLGQRLLLPDVPGLEPAGAIDAIVVRGTSPLLPREEEAAAGLLAVGERAGVERETVGLGEAQHVLEEVPEPGGIQVGSASRARGVHRFVLRLRAERRQLALDAAAGEEGVGAVVREVESHALLRHQVLLPALVPRQLVALEERHVLGGQPMVPRSLDEQAQVTGRRLPPRQRPRGAIGERRDALLSADHHLDGNPPVDAPMDPFTAIEAIELLGVEEVEHAARARARLGLDVGDRPLARADREVEAETVTLQPPPAGRQRTHPAALAEDGAAHVAAVAEVPDRVRRDTHGRLRQRPPWMSHGRAPSAPSRRSARR